MKKLSRLLIVCALGGLIVLGQSLFSEGQAANRQDSTSDPVPGVASKYVPALAGGCNNVSCHGRFSPREGGTINQNEVGICQEYDQHLQAYAILKKPKKDETDKKLKKAQERSQTIAKNLAVITGEKEIPPHQDQRCLACHSTPALADADPTFKNTKVIGLQAEGVSCQACHGPAQLSSDPEKSWISGHTRADKDYADFANQGMTQINNLAVQAKTCAACHVGSPPTTENTLNVRSRDLNHDLMAAGHPRLTFELTVFRMNQPPHWKQSGTTPNQTSRDYDARVWAIGQVASLKAQVDLTAYRAELAAKAEQKNATETDLDKQEPVLWPEFAEANCYACHADFQEGVIDDKATVQKGFWRATHGTPYYGKRTPGAPPYNNWYGYLAVPLSTFKQKDGWEWEAPTGVAEDYGKLQELMSSWTPDHKEVADTAKALSTKLDQWLASAPKPGKVNAQDLLNRLLAWKKEDKTVMSWDESMQWALAVAALNSDNFRDEPLTKRVQLIAMNELLGGLVYPKGFESPRGYGSEKVMAVVDAAMKSIFSAFGG